MFYKAEIYNTLDGSTRRHTFEAMNMDHAARKVSMIKETYEVLKTLQELETMKQQTQEKYNYHDSVLADVYSYIYEEFDRIQDFDSLEDIEEHLNEVLWTCDSVTGNASGSYTFSAYQAEENLLHNFDLLAEALEEFGCGLDYLKNGPEACDVTIRCYLLSGCISEALNNIMERGETA